MPQPSSNQEITALTVGQLTCRIKQSLEVEFADLWVSGEVTSLSQPRSGHQYFTLKDDIAQIRAVIWRSTAERIPFEIEEGMEVVCRGDIDVYPPRGSYQIVVRQVEPLGVGAQQLALEKLRAQLAAEGLFEPERKKRLPRLPRRIAIVTSPSGAAIHDFLQVLSRRWQDVHVVLIPAKVQGEDAAADIVRGIRRANRLLQTPGLAPQVLVVGRGGGSPEDLWCFNDERVVRAIADSGLPVVSAVGHEIDVTLSDLAADVRALTPSEAAERLVPDQAEMREALAVAQRRLAAALRTKVADRRLHVDALAARGAFRRPLEPIHARYRAVDEIQLRLGRAIERLQERSRGRVEHLAARLETLSPLAVLSRGYSVTTRMRQGDIAAASESIGQVLTRADMVEEGDTICTQLHQGIVQSRVTNVAADTEPPPGRKADQDVE